MSKTLTLVFINPPRMKATPFTTSKVIARFAGVQHESVQRMCEKYKTDLSEFGEVRFEIGPLPESKTGQSGKVYHLNEGQAILILAYLKNTPQVREFKKRLVREFQRMKAELTRREVNRAKLCPVRRSLTDAVRDCLPDTPNKSRYYKIYTDLAYKAVLGSNAARIRKERGAAPDANAVEYLTADEMEAVQAKEGQIAALIEAGMCYSDIRDVLLRQRKPPSGGPDGGEAATV